MGVLRQRFKGQADTGPIRNHKQFERPESPYHPTAPDLRMDGPRPG